MAAYRCADSTGHELVLEALTPGAACDGFREHRRSDPATVNDVPVLGYCDSCREPCFDEPPMPPRFAGGRHRCRRCLDAGRRR